MKKTDLELSKMSFEKDFRKILLEQIDESFKFIEKIEELIIENIDMQNDFIEDKQNNQIPQKEFEIANKYLETLNNFYNDIKNIEHKKIQTTYHYIANPK